MEITSTLHYWLGVQWADMAKTQFIPENHNLLYTHVKFKRIVLSGFEDYLILRLP
jgi:hypothetical protein